MRKRDLGILIICAFAILWSFRGEQGGYYFTEGWVIPIDTTLYSNLHYPTKGEKLPKPLITDLDGDGQNEIVYTSRDCTIKIAEMLPTMGIKAAPTPKAQSTLLRTTGVRTGRRPVGLASGYLQIGGGETKQVIVVVTEGWIVMCFDSNLDLLWENSPVDEVPEGYFHEEVAIMIAPHPVRIGDKGIVVVGGRLTTTGLDGQHIEHEHDDHHHVGPETKIEREEEGRHFSYYAFDGKSGALRWKHEEGDFFSKDPHEREEGGGEDDDIETFMPAHSFKQHVFSQSRHLGEVDWRQYREHVLAHLPYRWVDGFDSHFSLDRFEKKTNSGRKPSSSKSGDSTWNTEAIGIPNPLGNEDLATNQLTPKRDIEKPNVLVATVKGGLEVVHLFTGRPLCRLLLPPLEGSRSAGSYADVNGDGVIDSILSSVDLSALPSSSNPSHVSVSTNCLGVVSSGVPPVEQLWNGSICKASGLENMFRGMGLTPKTLTTIAPSFIPSTVTLGLNTIFMVSSGKISAFGPNGESLWQVGSTANWRAIDYPVLTPIHILPGDPTLHLIAIGTSLSLISPDGELLSNIRLRKTSDLQEANTVGSTIAGGPKHGEIWSVAPPTLGDIDNDGLADVIIVGHDGLYAFTMRRGMGSWLFASLVITLICVMLFALVQSEGGGIIGKSGSLGQRGSSARIKRALD